MKKTIALLSLFCLILTGISACAGKTDQGQGTQEQAVQEQEAPEQEVQDQDARTQEAQAQETQEQAAQQKDVFEAKESGIVFTIPDEYKKLKGTIVFEDFGDDIVAGQGHYVQMAGYYYPMSEEEADRLNEDELKAEEKGDIGAIMEIIEQMNYKGLFRIYGLDGGRGADDLMATLIPDYESVKDTYTEEEYEEYSASQKEKFLTYRLKEIGTFDGFTYILLTEDPELLRKGEPFPGYEDGYFEEYISLVENTDLIANNIQLVGGVELYEPVKLAETGTAIEFETTDLDGNPVKSEDLFAGHKVTMINLWGTWCGPCKRELPELEELSRELTEKGCRVIGIVTDAEEEEITEKARDILTEKGVTYLNLVPFEGMEDLLPQESWPTTYFVDENGVLIGEPITDAAPDKYRKMIDGLLE